MAKEPVRIRHERLVDDHSTLQHKPSYHVSRAGPLGEARIRQTYPFLVTTAANDLSNSPLSRNVTSSCVNLGLQFVEKRIVAIGICLSSFLSLFGCQLLRRPFGRRENAASGQHSSRVEDSKDQSRISSAEYGSASRDFT
ncbi:unnamed protein product [Protopolystoma xenopodis]|uniref:Uncharacterized protein n=1 Tax=Protopolystoma xenopodis TaxID=117903 RepID=A0A3S5A4P2_9PLAT|nr:unnamed protein product [Protopolystoma xenopodis]